MAKKKFLKNLSNHSGHLEKALEKYETETETKMAIHQANKNPNKETISNAVEVIKQDKVIPTQQKKHLLKQFEERYINIFENIPIYYSEIKAEAKFLSKITTHSFIFLAERLKIIRDQKLYLEDGYKKFSDFIKAEIEVTQSTVDKYLNIIDLFNPAARRDLLRPRNIFPFLPLFKTINNQNEKEALKNKILEIANNNTVRKSEEIAKQLKVEYGLLTSITSAQEINNWKKRIDKVENTDKLEILIDYMKKRLDYLLKKN